MYIYMHISRIYTHIYIYICTHICTNIHNKNATHMQQVGDILSVTEAKVWNSAPTPHQPNQSSTLKSNPKPLTEESGLSGLECWIQLGPSTARCSGTP